MPRREDQRCEARDREAECRRGPGARESRVLERAFADVEPERPQHGRAVGACLGVRGTARRPRVRAEPGEMRRRRVHYAATFLQRGDWAMAEEELLDLIERPEFARAYTLEDAWLKRSTASSR